jgi:hypothetical protein
MFEFCSKIYSLTFKILQRKPHDNQERVGSTGSILIEDEEGKEFKCKTLRVFCKELVRKKEIKKINFLIQ